MATRSRVTRLRSSRQTAQRATNASWTTSVSSLPSTTIPSTRSPSTVPFAASSSPPYYLLCINPAELDDWRNVHYRCCYSCATCHSEDFVWYSECSTLKPAKLGARGSISGGRYNNFDRTAVADFDDDNENTPGPVAHRRRQDSGVLRHVLLRLGLGRGEIPMDTSTSFPTQRPGRHEHRCQGLVRVVFQSHHIQTATALRTGTRPQFLLESHVRCHSPRTTGHIERWSTPRGACQDFGLTARFVADMDKLDPDRRARVMVAFEQWQVSSIARAIALQGHRLPRPAFHLSERRVHLRHPQPSLAAPDFHRLPNPRAAWALHMSPMSDPISTARRENERRCITVEKARARTEGVDHGRERRG